MKIKLTVCYDGTNYCGWQIQPNGLSVQQVVQEAIEKATGEKSKVVGSGRTDAGVHAQRQTAHFETNSSIPAERFYLALNAHLPSDVKVLASEKAEDNFDARKSAKRKTYCYSFYYGEVENPLKERYAVRLEKELNEEKIEKAINLLVGEHDFKAFCSAGSGAKTTVRTIYSIKIEKGNDGLKVLVTGNGFLYNMVRILVGTLLDVGYGKKTENDILEMLNQGKRERGGRTLPAKGLCLNSVEY